MSRQLHDDSNPHEIIPTSFHMYNTLYETYYRIETIDRYLVQPHSQMKAARIVLSDVHGAQKAIAIESPKPQIPIKQVDKNKPKLGQDRAGTKCKKLQPFADKHHQVNQVKYLGFKMLLKIVWIFQYQTD